ncbi:MAG TPA: ATP-binding protein [Acidobacteriaceae bacterium]|nr:ATP-binding protein [Acidobacteriaceae bacterium]
MRSGSQTRLLAILLAVVTLGAIGLAIANLVQESTYPAPTDAARWIETDGGLRAYIVPSGSAADKAGIRQGDVLTAIDGIPTPMVATANREMYRTGVWGHTTYSVLRQTSDWAKPIAIDIGVILEPTDRTDFQVERLIGLIYLAIGIYVLFRRWTAPKSTHFYVFCLMSFVLYAFKFTGVLDGLDLAVFWANIQAAALQPALFLHFALSFGERPRRDRNSLVYAPLYIPGAVLVVLRFLSVEHWAPTQLLQHRLDKIGFAYMAGYYIIAAAVFWVRYRREHQPLPRQQLKWLSRGTLLTVLPFTFFYVIPFLLDANTPGSLVKLATLSLVLLPLTFSWAIVRYRLMDVDLIFKRGVTYTLVTAALVGLYFVVIALSAEVVHTRFSGLGTWGLIAAIIITGLLFDPLKNWIQSWVDRVFDPKRLDYRETLIRFGRDLNAQTDLRALVDAIVVKLPQMLLVTRVAVFLPQDDAPQRFQLIASNGLNAQSTSLDLGFLDFDSPEAGNHLFFESPNAYLRLPESQRHTASALDLNYYIACRAARHEGTGSATVAVLGLGRTTEGDFLSSEDMMLLESLAGYIGIAIQNAQLYRRLERKVLEYERLHDFNENIVESINVGVFAVDLEDNIESWNAQMEVMLSTPRADALGHQLSDVFPPDFIAEFDRVRAEQGASTLYKFRLPTPSAELRTANITIAPLLNREFQAVGRIVIVDDITDRINMETQLTQSEKLSSIGLLAAGVAHEVNTPLAVISSYAQMLSKQLGKQLGTDEPTRARLQPVLEKITQQTFRASEIVNGLLNFSRMGSSEFSRVELNSVVRDTTLLLEHQLRSANVEVTTSLDESLPEISGNRGKLQQVLVNFMLNARDALQGREGARIRVTTHHTDSAVRLRVEDNGIGMSEAVLRRIYDPFFTTKNNPAQGQRKGTGLGLAVTYGIVQEHAGTIDVTSTVGEGTTFEVIFPAAESPGRTSITGSSVDEGKVIHV